MELCESPISCEAETYEKDLKICLGKLHCLKFIHKDIKVENTVFSPYYNKYVLIDFGITHLIEENIWEKT